MAAGINVLGYCTSADVASSSFMEVVKAIQFPLRKIYERPEKYMIVRTAKDIREAKEKGKLGFYFVHQGTKQFEGDVDRVAVMRQLGYGYCLLVYNVHNDVGGGCTEDNDNGLTAYGRKLIKAYNRCGAKGVFGSFRNLNDELIKAIAGTGGVCSIFSTGAYVDPTNPAVVGPEILFKHIDYMVQLVGNTNHVGYGSDWIPDMNKTMELVMSKADTYPDKGLPPGTTRKAISMYGPTPMPARIMPAVVDRMLEHGYSEKDCAKVLGGNNLRVFEKVWSGSDVAISGQPLFHEDWR